MATTASTRRQTALEHLHLFGHCTTSFVGGKSDCEQCPGKYTAPWTTANYPKGTVVRCQCSCHGEVPEAWPGRNAAISQKPQEAPGDENDDESGDPSDEQSEALTAPLEDSVEETVADVMTSDLLQSLQDAAATDESERSTAVVSSTEPPVLDGELRRIRYLEGWVLKVEGSGWMAFDLAAEHVGTESSLKGAKSLIGAR